MKMSKMEVPFQISPIVIVYILIYSQDYIRQCKILILTSE